VNGLPVGLVLIAALLFCAALLITKEP